MICCDALGAGQEARPDTRRSSSNGPQFLPVAFLLRQEQIISG
jgi:hypothetical protein